MSQKNDDGQDIRKKTFDKVFTNVREDTRYAHLKDYFTFTCNKCGSTDVDLTAEECHECGIEISGECNKCGAKYDYHDFKQVKIRYGKDPKTGRMIEIWREPL